ncbi:MAG: Crp/Fnr family transcriptional regulator [Candidatus Binatia bacterium]
MDGEVWSVMARSSGSAPRSGNRRSSPHSVGLAGKVDALRRLALFGTGSDEELAKLATAASMRRLRRGQRLVRSALGGHLVAMAKGLIAVSLARDEANDDRRGELIVDILVAGGVSVDWCWGGQEFASHGAVVGLDDAVVMLVPRGPLESYLAVEVGAALRLLATVAAARARAVAMAVQNAHLGIGDRLYCRLVELAHLRGRPVVGGLLVEHGLAQSQLAAFANASRENVNRQLGEWRADGWIALKRGAVLVRHADALSRSVSPLARRVGFGAGDGRLPLA